MIILDLIVCLKISFFQVSLPCYLHKCFMQISRIFTGKWAMTLETLRAGWGAVSLQGEIRQTDSTLHNVSSHLAKKTTFPKWQRTIKDIYPAGWPCRVTRTISWMFLSGWGQHEKRNSTPRWTHLKCTVASLMVMVAWEYAFSTSFWSSSRTQWCSPIAPFLKGKRWDRNNRSAVSLLRSILLQHLNEESQTMISV